ncbi:MAG TPA: chaperone NapD [Symbiobacteriaceae bacterium]|jgi:nitrate reductase NapAB chaperone NapD
MVIAGVVIDVKTDQAVAAMAALEGMPGISRLEGPVTPGRLAAVLEAENEAEVTDLCTRMLTAPGVVNVNPAFIHFDVEEESRV